MNVDLGPDLEKLIEARVTSGLYGSPIEVIGDALRLLDERDHLQKSRWRELRGEIARGLEQLEQGEKAPLDVNEIKRKARGLRARLGPVRASGW